MQITDLRVGVSGGSVFTRQWQPPTRRAGPSIFLFHESLGSIGLWRGFPQLLAFKTGLPVIAYDRLGFGRSDASPGKLAPSFIEDEAQNVAPKVRAAFQVDEFIAVGHSVGGAMAIASAVTSSSICRGVVTLSSLAFVEERTRAGIHKAIEHFEKPEHFDQLRRHHDGKARWVLNAWTETWLGPHFADWTIDHYCAGVTCPILAIHGDKDEFSSVVHPQRIIASSSGQGAVQIIDNCGHVPHRERPEPLLDYVADFVSRLCR